MSEENEVKAEEIPQESAEKAIRYHDVERQLLAAHTAMKVLFVMTHEMAENCKCGNNLLMGVTKPGFGLEDLERVSDIGLAGIDSVFDIFGVPSPVKDEQIGMRGAAMLSVIMAISKVKDAEDAKEEGQSHE